MYDRSFILNFYFFGPRDGTDWIKGGCLEGGGMNLDGIYANWGFRVDLESVL